MIHSDTIKKCYISFNQPEFEEKIHDYLLRKNFELFLPLNWVINQWSDRKKQLKIPLFPIYIFVSIERERISKVLKIPKIVRRVSFIKKPGIKLKAVVSKLIRLLKRNLFKPV